MKFAARWLFILCLPFLLIAANVSWSVNTVWLYDYGFSKFGISRVTGLSPGELHKAAGGWIRYINSAEEPINVIVSKNGAPFTLFNEREAAHLKDVKGLFRFIYGMSLGTLAYALLFVGLSLFAWKDRRQLAPALIGGSYLTLGIVLVMGVSMLFNFDQFFLRFHLLSFTNDLWQLDPTRDYLIMLFPRGFWYDAFLFWAVTAALGAIILGGVGWLLRKKSAPNT